jgi:hypothetical protein
MADPYRTLWAAVLEQAIKDIQGDLTFRKGNVRSIFCEGAWAWFRSESQDVGSFLWTCSMLGLEPDFVLSFVTSDKTKFRDRRNSFARKSENLL